MNHSTHRDSIFIENSIILNSQHFAGKQHIIRLQSPQCAQTAIAGQFVHLQCDASLPLRRPFSIMRSNASGGWVELLYKEVGNGTVLLAKQKKETALSLLGPIGRPFSLHSDRSIRLLIGGGVGIPPMIFLAETIATQYPQDKDRTFVLMGSELPFPFTQSASAYPMAGVPKKVNMAISDIESLGIASRLASLNGFTGCHKGYVTELANELLKSISTGRLNNVEIFGCGPRPMLAAIKLLATEYQVPCQVSLEEFMACAVGGCAGCTVRVNTKNGATMQRVCVDGPVFDATTIIF